MTVDSVSWTRDIGLLGWLIKDLGWVLLLPAVAWPAALVAIGVESHLAVSEWGHSSTGVRAHTFAELCWLVGNCIWMSAELLYDKKPRNFLPWYSGTVMDNDTKAYNTGANVSLVILCVGFFVLMGYYLYRIGQHFSGRGGRHENVMVGNPQDDAIAQPEEETLVFGYISEDIYTRMFLLPWIAKDIAWNMEWSATLVFFGTLVVIIAVDYVHRYGGPHFWAELFWFLGNAVWAWSELVASGPATNVRLVGAMLLVWGIACVVTANVCPKLTPWSGDAKEYNAASAGERQPLMSSGRGAGSSGLEERRT